MKPGKPLARRTPLTADPGKAREWQARSAQAAAARARDRHPQPTPQPVYVPRHGVPATAAPRRRSPRRNDSQWRVEVLTRFGAFCHVRRRWTWADPSGPGQCDGPIEIDHVHPRGQGGQSDVLNGMPLCRRHHQMRTENRLRVDRAMLHREQEPYLRVVGWVWWDATTGETYGRGRNHFLPDPPAGDTE